MTFLEKASVYVSLDFFCQGRSSLDFCSVRVGHLLTFFTVTSIKQNHFLKFKQIKKKTVKYFCSSPNDTTHSRFFKRRHLLTFSIGLKENESCP
jgi:hypothetical protein